MKRVFWVVFIITAVLLAGCGGAETAVSNAPVIQVDMPVAETALDLGPAISVITLAEIKDRDDVFVIDVREQWEYDEKHIPGVTLIPLATIPDSLSQIPTDKTVILTCRSGNRSGQAADFLRAQGFDNVHNMEGGILAWEAAGFDVEQ